MSSHHSRTLIARMARTTPPRPAMHSCLCITAGCSRLVATSLMRMAHGYLPSLGKFVHMPRHWSWILGHEWAGCAITTAVAGAEMSYRVPPGAAPQDRKLVDVGSSCLSCDLSAVVPRLLLLCTLVISFLVIRLPPAQQRLPREARDQASRCPSQVNHLGRSLLVVGTSY